MHNEFTAIIEPADEGGFVAFCVEVPEANGQGETEAEALENLRGSIEFVFEARREDALKELPPSSKQAVISVG